MATIGDDSHRITGTFYREQLMPISNVDYDIITKAYAKRKGKQQGMEGLGRQQGR